METQLEKTMDNDMESGAMVKDAVYPQVPKKPPERILLGQSMHNSDDTWTLRVSERGNWKVVKAHVTTWHLGPLLRVNP